MCWNKCIDCRTRICLAGIEVGPIFAASLFLQRIQQRLCGVQGKWNKKKREGRTVHLRPRTVTNDISSCVLVHVLETNNFHLKKRLKYTIVSNCEFITRNTRLTPRSMHLYCIICFVWLHGCTLAYSNTNTTLFPSKGTRLTLRMILYFTATS